MFRLAALYEERARADADADLSQALRARDGALPAHRRDISRATRSWPRVAYYLGHAYTDAAAWRRASKRGALSVCINRYPLASDATDAVQSRGRCRCRRITTKRFWTDWYNRNPIPLDQLPERQRDLAPGRRRAKSAKSSPSATRTPAARRIAKTSARPRAALPGRSLVAARQLPFRSAGRQGGPYSLNRAMSAYERSMEFKKPPLYGVAMYKRAWTYFKQQRYHTAVDWFVNLLHYADEQEAQTGDPGADFRAEAYTYIAGSLTYVDFDGPARERSEHTAQRRAGRRARSGRRRGEDGDRHRSRAGPDTDPAGQEVDRRDLQGARPRVHRDHAEPQRDRGPGAHAQQASRWIATRPKMQNKVATLYDQLARLAPGRLGRARTSTRAGRSKRGPSSPPTSAPRAWTNANRDDAEAIQPPRSWRSAACSAPPPITPTTARAFVGRAQQASSEAEQRSLLEQAIEGYRMAEQGWAAVHRPGSGGAGQLREPLLAG